jgi:hypothetical protein
MFKLVRYKKKFSFFLFSFIYEWFAFFSSFFSCLFVYCFSEAYNVLIDEEKRKIYDKHGRKAVMV